MLNLLNIFICTLSKKCLVKQTYNRQKKNYMNLIKYINNKFSSLSSLEDNVLLVSDQNMQM